MSHFTVVLFTPDFAAHVEPPQACTFIEAVEADDAGRAINAAAAIVIGRLRKNGMFLRPEEFAPIAVFPGRLVNLMTPAMIHH